MSGGGAAPDEALMERWRAGDREAGEVLFARHFDAIYDFFARKVSGDVSDLVQRTFLGCVEGRDQFRGDASPRTYLFTIARHELYRHFRSRRRDAALDFGVTSLRALGPTPTSLLGRRDRASRLLAALETLPLELQLLVELRFWEGLKQRELAAALDLPQGTVASRLRRALELLREAFEGEPDARSAFDDERSFEDWARALAPSRRGATEG